MDYKVKPLMYEVGKQENFSRIVNDYQRKVYNVVRKMVITHDDADDITQEVFIKVWNHIENFQEESSLFTWIYRIAVNESLMFLRRERRRRLFGGFTEELISRLTSEKFVDGDEIQRKLQKAILQLPDKQRLVFNLKYFDDLSYEEIADITETSVGALKASYHHAVKKIEEFLQRD